MVMKVRVEKVGDWLLENNFVCVQLCFPIICVRVYSTVYMCVAFHCRLFLRSLTKTCDGDTVKMNVAHQGNKTT